MYALLAAKHDEDMLESAIPPAPNAPTDVAVAASESSPRKCVRVKHAQRLPRKTRIDKGKLQKLQTKSKLRILLPRLFVQHAELDHDGSRPKFKRRRAGNRNLTKITKRRPLKSPVDQTQIVPNRSIQQQRSLTDQSGLVARLRAGRTLERLLSLMQMHMFKGPLALDASTRLQPKEKS